LNNQDLDELKELLKNKRNNNDSPLKNKSKMQELEKLNIDLACE